MPLTTAQQAALDRLKSFYEGDNPYNSVTNPGGFRQGGHLYNFVPALKDIATVVAGVSALAIEVATNSAQSPKAVRVDGAQSYTDAEKAQGQANLGLAAVLTSFLAKAGGVMTGGLTLQYDTARIRLKQVGGTYDGKAWDMMHYSQDGRLYFQDMNNDQFVGNPVYFGRDGSIGTAQIGDLNTRIEARALAYAAQRLPLTGGTMTGPLYAPYVVVNGTDGNSGYQLNSRTNSDDNVLTVNQGGVYSIYNQKVGYSPFNLNVTTGAINTREFGDLNTRIEARARAFADAAQAAAISADAAKLSKAGDTMTGDLTISKGGSSIWLKQSGGTYDSKQWRLYHYEGDSNLYLQDYTGSSSIANTHYFSRDGSVWTKQFGDLNGRIEARGLAYQQVAQSTSAQKTGDTLTGSLTFSQPSGAANLATPGVKFSYPNNADHFIRAISGNRLQVCDQGATVEYFSVGADGSVSTRQFGDLNARIEARASAYAANATGEAQYRFHAARMVFVGDLNQNSNPGGMTSPYGGNAVVTDRWTYDQGLGSYIDYAKRFRQPQFLSTTQGWVAITLA